MGVVFAAIKVEMRPRDKMRGSENIPGVGPAGVGPCSGHIGPDSAGSYWARVDKDLVPFSNQCTASVSDGFDILGAICQWNLSIKMA